MSIFIITRDGQPFLVSTDRKEVESWWTKHLVTSQLSGQFELREYTALQTHIVRAIYNHIIGP